MTRNDLQTLANLRLREAQILLSAGEFSGAYYLAGYAVECALKACIAKQTVEHEFPDKKRADASYNHDFEKLIRTAGLEARLQENAVTMLLSRLRGRLSRNGLKQAGMNFANVQTRLLWSQPSQT